MKRVAQRFALSSDINKSDSVVKLLEEPIQRYADNTRDASEATLWIWSTGGRPSAILGVEFYPDYRSDPSWLYEITSLSTSRIGVKNDLGWNWEAAKPGLELRSIDMAEAPATKAAQRLVQMRSLLSRFKAIESAVIENRIELRPMTRPLFRYTDGKQGITDGAIFAFANGTNPEVFVILESHTAEDGDSVWRYGLAQMTGGALSVELDGKEVWRCEEALPPTSREAYANGWIKADEPKE